jgi:hypothetical protein
MKIGEGRRKGVGMVAKVVRVWEWRQKKGPRGD